MSLSVPKSNVNRAIGYITGKAVNLTNYKSINIVYDLTISSFSDKSNTSAGNYVIMRAVVGNSNASTVGFADVKNVKKVAAVGNKPAGTTVKNDTLLFHYHYHLSHWH